MQWYCITLECGDEVYTQVLLRMQYPDDYHLIRCPKKCEPTAWKRVSGVRRVSEDAVLGVHCWVETVSAGHILRIQPSVPRSRIRLFPYKSGG